MESPSPPPAKRVKLAEDPPQPQLQPVVSAKEPSFTNTVEHKVGITEYLNPTTEGFTGVLKQRYTDFLVNEITPEGEVVHLKGWEVPRRDEKKVPEEQPVGGKATDGEKSTEAQPVEDTKPAERSINAVIEVPEVTPPEAQSVQSLPTISPEDCQHLLSLIGQEVLSTLLERYASISLPSSASTPTATSPILAPRIDSKESRTDLHRSIRRIFSGTFETTTLEGAGNEGIISIKASRNAGGSSRGGRPDRGGRGGRGGRRGGGGRSGGEPNQNPWPNGEFMHFTLHKENRDTMEVLGMLGRILGLPRQLQHKTFQFAGTKDKRAVTVQRVSAFKIAPARLAAANFGGGGGRGGKGLGGLRLPRGCKVGNFEFRHTGLELGDLSGNEFRITLRDVHPTNTSISLTVEEQESCLREIVGASMSSLSRNGFINYYGLQRFGTFVKGTHEVGIKMLRGDWKSAILDEIMHHDSHLLTRFSNAAAAEAGGVSRDEYDRAKACHLFIDALETLANDAEKYDKKLTEAIGLMPRKYLAETAVLGAARDRVGGSASKLDWLQVLMRIPRGLRMMYIHSYQSYVWNHAASERIRLFGREGVVEGDLVFIGAGDKTDRGVDSDIAMNCAGEEEEELLDQDGEPIIRDTSTPALPSLSAKLTRDSDNDFQRARPLTKIEAESGTYSLIDVVLPTPGYDVEYPPNKVFETYVEVMKMDGLDPKLMRRSVREVSLSGGYRKLVGAVGSGGVEWEVKRVRGLEQCVETDLEKVEREKREARAVKDGVEEAKAEETKTEEQEEVKLAVVLKFQLGTSMYATMALREVMKAGVQSYQPEFGHAGAAGAAGASGAGAL